MSNSDNPADLTGPDEPAKRLPKHEQAMSHSVAVDPTWLITMPLACTGHEPYFSSRTPLELHGQVTAHCLAIRRGSDEKPGHCATIS